MFGGALPLEVVPGGLGGGRGVLVDGRAALRAPTFCFQRGTAKRPARLPQGWRRNGAYPAGGGRAAVAAPLR